MRSNSLRSFPIVVNQVNISDPFWAFSIIEPHTSGYRLFVTPEHLALFQHQPESTIEGIQEYLLARGVDAGCMRSLETTLCEA
jgi:hypothetical protein